MGLDWLISRNAGGSTRMSNDVYVRFFVFAVLRFFTWGGPSVRHLPRSTPHVTTASAVHLPLRAKYSHRIPNFISSQRLQHRVWGISPLNQIYPTQASFAEI